MAYRVPEPPINPPDLYAREEKVECPECGEYAPVEAGHATCPSCGEFIDEDAVRDQLEAADEPPEWA